MVNLLDFDREGLAAYCEQLGEKRFRATQLFRWIHQKGARDFDAMTDLAKSLRDKLRGVAEVTALPVASEQTSTERLTMNPKSLFRCSASSIPWPATAPRSISVMRMAGPANTRNQ